jgi:hypothetical protein
MKALLLVTCFLFLAVFRSSARADTYQMPDDLDLYGGILESKDDRKSQIAINCDLRDSETSACLVTQFVGLDRDGQFVKLSLKIDVFGLESVKNRGISSARYFNSPKYFAWSNKAQIFVRCMGIKDGPCDPTEDENLLRIGGGFVAATTVGAVDVIKSPIVKLLRKRSRANYRKAWTHLFSTETKEIVRVPKEAFWNFWYYVHNP